MSSLDCISCCRAAFCVSKSSASQMPLYGYLYFAIAVHVFVKAFQLGLQLTEKGGIRVGAAYHSHGVVRLHLGDPAPDKIPHRQQGSSDQHHIIPVVVPPVGTLLRRGQGRGRFLDQVFGVISRS